MLVLLPISELENFPHSMAVVRCNLYPISLVGESDRTRPVCPADRPTRIHDGVLLVARRGGEDPAQYSVSNLARIEQRDQS